MFYVLKEPEISAPCFQNSASGPYLYQCDLVHIDTHSVYVVHVDSSSGLH